jgi:hypothetical protein
LKIKQDVDLWGPGYHWVLNAEGAATGGAFVAKTTQIISELGPGGELPELKCLEVCQNDPQCIAAIMLRGRQDAVVAV